MRFPLPLRPAEFEIPDEWWAEAGMAAVTLSDRAYRSSAPAALIPIRSIEPPYRLPERTLDCHGFDRRRLISILSGIATGAMIEPVSLREIPPADMSPTPFSYRVRHGFHRFYASVAAGFSVCRR